MAEIELYDHERKYKSGLKALERSSTSERNKAFIKEFLNDCTIGWGGKKLRLPRIVKYLYQLRVLAEMLGRDFDYITQEDVKRILVAIDSDQNKGEWSRIGYRIALRKFVKWLREEHGYLKDYPNARYLTKIFHWKAELYYGHTLAIDFNYLVFNILSVLFLLFVFLSFKKVATIVHNATTVGAYEKSMLIENTISEFLRSTKKIETLTPDFRFSNFERNLFLAFMLIILVPVALSGDSETIKRAVIQITNGQPGYKEFEYFESSNENLIEANENLAGSSSFLDRVNYLLAFGERRHVIKLDVSATPNKVSRQKAEPVSINLKIEVENIGSFVETATIYARNIPELKFSRTTLTLKPGESNTLSLSFSVRADAPSMAVTTWSEITPEGLVYILPLIAAETKSGDYVTKDAMILIE